MNVWLSSLIFLVYRSFSGHSRTWTVRRNQMDNLYESDVILHYIRHCVQNGDIFWSQSLSHLDDDNILLDILLDILLALKICEGLIEAIFYLASWLQLTPTTTTSGNRFWLRKFRAKLWMRTLTSLEAQFPSSLCQILLQGRVWRSRRPKNSSKPSDLIFKASWPYMMFQLHL